MSLCLLLHIKFPKDTESVFFLIIPSTHDNDDDNEVPGTETIFYHLMNKFVYCLELIGDFPPLNFLSTRKRTRIRPQNPARNVLGGQSWDNLDIYMFLREKEKRRAKESFGGHWPLRIGWWAQGTGLFLAYIGEISQ